MSQANDLLKSVVEMSDTAGSGASEEHIVIGKDRYIVVPEQLRKIAVQYDHDIETVTFDCPRYWDEHDFSTMAVYINYMRPDGELGSAIAKNIVVDAADSNIVHFDWTVSGNVTAMNGELKFVVCVKKVDAEGNEERHWNSELCSDMYITEGLECTVEAAEQYPDIITGLLVRMDELEAIGLSHLVDVEEIAGGHRVTLKDSTGTKTIDVMDGAVFTPSVSANGDLSWTNDQGLPNPPTVNIKGPQGEVATDRIKEVNDGDWLQFWMGTTAEYEALGTETKEGVVYIFEDDSTLDEIMEVVNKAEAVENRVGGLETNMDIVMDDITSLKTIVGDSEGGEDTLQTRLSAVETTLTPKGSAGYIDIIARTALTAGSALKYAHYNLDEVDMYEDLPIDDKFIEIDGKIDGLSSEIDSLKTEKGEVEITLYTGSGEATPNSFEDISTEDNILVAIGNITLDKRLRVTYSYANGIQKTIDTNVVRNFYNPASGATKNFFEIDPRCEVYAGDIPPFFIVNKTLVLNCDMQGLSAFTAWNGIKISRDSNMVYRADQAVFTEIQNSFSSDYRAGAKYTIHKIELLK